MKDVYLRVFWGWFSGSGLEEGEAVLTMRGRVIIFKKNEYFTGNFDSDIKSTMRTIPIPII